MSDDYHQDYDHVSKTMLSTFCDSPDLFNRYYVEQSARPPQPASVTIGSIVHDVVLEGRELTDVAHMYPDDCLNVRGGLIGQKAAEFRGSLPDGCYAVKDEEYRLCASIINAIRQQDIIQAPYKICEVPIRWTQTLLDGGSIKCRCKPDILIELPEAIMVVDLKITEQPKPFDFARVASRFRYWLQDAHYSAGIFSKYGKPVDFQFMVVEQSHSPRIGIYKYNELSREAATIEWEKILSDLICRRETEDWADAWTQEVTSLDLRPWETPYTQREENELEALEWSE